MRKEIVIKQKFRSVKMDIIVSGSSKSSNRIYLYNYFNGDPNLREAIPIIKSKIPELIAALKEMEEEK